MCSQYVYSCEVERKHIGTYPMLTVVCNVEGLLKYVNLRIKLDDALD